MQSKAISAIEATCNTAIGYCVSVAIGQVVYPLFGYPITLHDNAALTAIFVAASLLRSYAFRRLFSRWLNRRLKQWMNTLSSKWQSFRNRSHN